jgi:pyruvate/2-oxoglutarate/acetoin dehydrogenase E1 component
MEHIKIKYKDAIRDSMETIESIDKNIIFLGYNVKYGGKGDGSLINISEDKLIETPVAENLMASMAIGLSLEGFTPVIYYERFDFILNALDAIINHLDKIELLSNGEYKPKVIIRVVKGGILKPFFTGATHIQDFTDAIKMMVKFNVVKLPLNYDNIKQIYLDALKSNNSTLIVEEKDLYDEIVNL